jgi:hypothetical protein
MKSRHIVACVVAGLFAIGVAAGCRTAGSGPRAERKAEVFSNAPADHPFAKITKGMSKGETIAILGQPTEEGTSVTGKIWIPFNFRGQGTQLTVLHYKGQGRIYLENSSMYSTKTEAVKVEYDPNEPGFAR